ncbi:hypothetical protein DIPPA_08968 [Diplonema papillatum]|nr:hypothetical protein DIPPA_08968 [Diplonema papillatum]|eukprot:gene822-1265_t
MVKVNSKQVTGWVAVLGILGIAAVVAGLVLVIVGAAKAKDEDTWSASLLTITTVDSAPCTFECCRRVCAAGEDLGATLTCRSERQCDTCTGVAGTWFAVSSLCAAGVPREAACRPENATSAPNQTLAGFVNDDCSAFAFGADFEAGAPRNLRDPDVKDPGDLVMVGVIVMAAGGFVTLVVLVVQWATMGMYEAAKAEHAEYVKKTAEAHGDPMGYFDEDPAIEDDPPPLSTGLGL